MQNHRPIKNMVPPALHEGILYSGIKALRYGNLLPNKYRVTESGNDLVAVSISDIKWIKSKAWRYTVYRAGRDDPLELRPRPINQMS